MNTPCSLLVGFALGTGIGLGYFAGLWLTVRHLAFSANPKRLLSLSRTFRLLVALAIMVAAIRFAPVMSLTLLPGFIAGRFLICRLVVSRPGEGGRASYA